LSAERCKHMSARRTNRRKVSLLSTTVHPDTRPSRGRQLNTIFGSCRGCKSRFYAGCRLFFLKNSRGGTSAGMHVFFEMGGMRPISVACTLRSRPWSPRRYAASLPPIVATRSDCAVANPCCSSLSPDPVPSSGRRQQGGRAYLAGPLRNSDQPQRHLAYRMRYGSLCSTIPYQRHSESASFQAVPCLSPKLSIAPADTGRGGAIARHLALQRIRYARNFCLLHASAAAGSGGGTGAQGYTWTAQAGVLGPVNIPGLEIQWRKGCRRLWAT
jgi:hypothetical protein